MQIELSAASRHEHLVLFDPAAIPPGTPVDRDLAAQDPNPLSKTAMMDLAVRGQALIFHIATEDCEARMRILVGDDPPEHIRTRGTSVLENARLRVPSGTLKADGLEFLTRPGEVREASQGETGRVPAGVYGVAVLDLMSWKLRHRAEESRRSTSSKAIAVHRLVVTYTWLGVLFIPANLFVAPMVIAYFWRRGWASALTAAAIILAIDAAILAGFWLLEAAKKRLPVLSRVSDADAAFDRKNPDLVVLLTPGANEDSGQPAFAAIQVAR